MGKEYLLQHSASTRVAAIQIQVCVFFEGEAKRDMYHSLREIILNETAPQQWLLLEV